MSSVEPPRSETLNVPMAPPPSPQPVWLPAPPTPAPPAPAKGGFARGFGAGAGAGIGLGTVLAIGMVVSALIFGVLAGVSSVAAGGATPLETVWGSETARNQIRAIATTMVI